MGRKSSAVYNVNYHFVWCPKYRKPILEEPRVKEFLEDQIHTIAETKEHEILALEVMPDHIHLFISTTPFEDPTAIVKVSRARKACTLSTLARNS